MQTTLEEINSLPGVIGSFVCLPDGCLAAKAMPDSFDAVRLELAARVARKTFDALETFHNRVTETDLVFDQNHLILKNLHDGILAILCVRNINLPLLNFTLNVAAKKISAELKPPKAAPVTTPREAAPGVTAPKVPDEVTPNPRLEVASGSIVPPSEPAGEKFFNQLTRELTRLMGAFASVVIEDEIKSLKETRETFPQARTAELVERVSEAIHDESKRTQFRRIMLEAIRSL